jgi:hypothetical protein
MSPSQPLPRPTPETLRAFFRDRRTLPLMQAASLLGWPRETVKRRAIDEERTEAPMRKLTDRLPYAVAFSSEAF